MVWLMVCHASNSKPTSRFLLRKEIPRVFTSEVEVHDIADQLAPIMWGGYAVLAVGDACFGVLEGQGRSDAQAGAWAASLVVGLPLCICSFEYSSFGLVGLWGGMVAGYLVLSCIGMWLVARSNWSIIVKECAERSKDVDG
jgi:Na+-driven multidrug efflux pump